MISNAPRDNAATSRRALTSRAAVLSLATILAAGCTTGSFMSSKSEGTTSSGSVPFGDRISALFGGSSPPQSASQTAATPTSEEFDCPRIDIRQGASTLLVNASASEPNPLALRYQGSFVRAARECRVVGTNVNIKIGVQGRVILGPAGGPGQVTIPLRYALIQETMNDSKPIWSKLQIIPVTIPPQTPNVGFTHIVDDLTVPIPSAADLENWVIYIGFDPAGAEAQQKRKPGRSTSPRRAPQPQLQ
jgi:hypothetical protein